MIINNDYKVQPNSIHAKAVSMPMFQQMVQQAYNKLPSDFQYGNLVDILMNEEDREDTPKHLQPFASVIPYDHEIELSSAEPNPPYCPGFQLAGFIMLPNNVPIFGIMAAADYSAVAMYIVYPNKNGQLDVYVPVRGNAVNPHTKAIIGHSNYPLDDRHMQKYGFTLETLILDGTAMKDELIQAMKVYP